MSIKTTNITQNNIDTMERNSVFDDKMNLCNLILFELRRIKLNTH